jgi:hypothetical protein
MATKTIAGHRTPGSSPDGNEQDATDLLENTLAQLEALTWTLHGEDIDWSSGEGPRHLANMHWLADDLTRRASELFQQSQTARLIAHNANNAHTAQPAHNTHTANTAHNANTAR